MYEGIERELLARELSTAIAAGGPWTSEAIAERAASCLDRWPRWLDSLALTLAASERARTAPSMHRELSRLIARFLAERPLTEGEPAEPPGVIRLLSHPPVRAPRPEDLPIRRYVLEHDWPLAPIASTVELAEVLELSDGQLEWLADVKGYERTVKALKLRNYRYAAVPRRSGLPRLIEAPKARLKEIQRWIVHEILDHVPPHPAAHGFTLGRSAISHAEQHVGRPAVLTLDLKDFFASVSAARVYGIFCTLGYQKPVALRLTGLATNAIPREVWHAIPTPTDPKLIHPHFWLGRQLATPHLPQGAPSSPALANLAAYRLDRRLSGLAARSGLTYTRYADDLTFSGGRLLSGRTRGLSALVGTIVREEGFRLNADKRTFNTAASRQSVCGIVINARPNVARAEYDTLKAILHNATRDGAQSQNKAGVQDFEAHLRGRIAWVAALNPSRGEKLRRRFAEIDWTN